MLRPPRHNDLPVRDALRNTVSMLSHYRCINDELVDEVIAQLSPVVQGKEVTWKVKTPIGERSSKSSPTTLSRVERVELAEDLLRDTGLLRAFRPETESEFREFNEEDEARPWFCFEWLQMTPVHLPSRELGPRTFTPDLTVWVADPTDDLKWRAVQPPDHVGSFLFLVEEIGSFQTVRFISGISALRLLVDFVARPDAFRVKDLFEARRTKDELGRFNAIHPVEKLKLVGGYAGRRRPVAAIYRIVYMTNEQAYTTEAEEHVRVNDILAYPLFIAE